MEHKGVKITVEENGMFAAEYDGMELKTETLKAMREKINKMQGKKINSVKVFCEIGWDCEEFYDTEIMSVANEAMTEFWVRHEGSRLKMNLRELMKHDAKRVEELQVLRMQIKGLEKKRDDVRDSLRFERDELLKLLGLGIRGW